MSLVGNWLFCCTDLLMFLLSPIFSIFGEKSQIRKSIIFLNSKASPLVASIRHLNEEFLLFMEIKWQTPSSNLHLLSVHQVIWQQHHFLGICNLLRRFMPEWNFALEIHVQAYDMHSDRYLFSLLTYIRRRTSTWSVGCKHTSQHVQTCSPAYATWLQDSNTNW